jgi:transposase-like protein
MWNVISQKNGVSAMSIDRALGIGSYKTAWIWLHKIRRAMVRPGRDRLHGIVQVDETFIGGKSHGKRGRGAAGKSLVLVAVEKDGNGSGRIRLKQIPDASGQSLNEALQLTVEPGSIVETDDWKGYSQIGKKGYKRQIIRTTCDLGDNLLPLCHRQAALLKRWLDGTHHGAVSHEHLCYYLDEYTFRFNRRTSSHRGKLFYRLLQNAISINPTHLDDIAKGIRGKTHGKTHNI